MREDAFWGDDFWPDIEHRSHSLTDGVKQLALQCLELQSSADSHSHSEETANNDESHLETLRQSNCTWKQVKVPGEEQKRLSKMTNCYLQSRGHHQRFHVRSAESRRRTMT